MDKDISIEGLMDKDNSIGDCGFKKRAGIVLTFCFSLAAAALFSAGPSFAQTVDQAVQTVEKHYQDLTDLKAKVVQKNHLASIGKTQVFKGTLYIKKPGKLRLDYTNGQIILIDGTSVLLYSKKNDQVIKRTFTDFEQMNIPVAFLLGAAGRIRDDFEAIQPDRKMPRRLELIPKKPGAAMKKLVLNCDDAGRILELSIYDRSGNVTEIHFSEIQEGTGLGEKLFRFKIPKGTEVIEQ